MGRWEVPEETKINSFGAFNFGFCIPKVSPHVGKFSKQTGNMGKSMQLPLLVSELISSQRTRFYNIPSESWSRGWNNLVLWESCLSEKSDSNHSFSLASFVCLSVWVSFQSIWLMYRSGRGSVEKGNWFQLRWETDSHKIKWNFHWMLWNTHKWHLSNDMWDVSFPLIYFIKVGMPGIR